MAFLNIRFPLEIGGFANGGGEWLTNIVTMEDGREQRISVWSQEKSSFTISGVLRTRTPGYLSFDALNSLHKEARGRAHTFRFRDQKDYKATKVTGCLEQGFGTGYPTLQLHKKYVSNGGLAYFRELTKPVQGTLKIYINAVEATGFVCDFNTGKVTCPILANVPVIGVTVGSNPVVTTAGSHSFTNGQKIYITFFSGSNLNNKAFTISEVTATTFKLAGATNNINATGSVRALKYLQPTDIANAEFEFDLEVRFDNDKINAVINDGLIEIDNISLVETKNA